MGRSRRGRQSWHVGTDLPVCSPVVRLYTSDYRQLHRRTDRTAVADAAPAAVGAGASNAAGAAAAAAAAAVQEEKLPDRLKEAVRCGL